MDGGCRASSLGVLINKLSQSCRAPSNRPPNPPPFPHHPSFFPQIANPPPRHCLGLSLKLFFPLNQLVTEASTSRWCATVLRDDLQNVKLFVLGVYLRALMRTLGAADVHLLYILLGLTRSLNGGLESCSYFCSSSEALVDCIVCESPVCLTNVR